MLELQIRLRTHIVATNNPLKTPIFSILLFRDSQRRGR